MKIAVCIFGQPRFYKEAAESFRQEFFDMPNHEVDVFIHCWDEIGYTPDDDINETNASLTRNKTTVRFRYKDEENRLISYVKSSAAHTAGPDCLLVVRDSILMPVLDRKSNTTVAKLLAPFEQASASKSVAVGLVNKTAFLVPVELI